MTTGLLEFGSVDDGVLTVTMRNPPVNAVNYSGYIDLQKLAEISNLDKTINAVVLTADSDCKAWCAGADLNEPRGNSIAARKERYELIEQTLSKIAGMRTPIVAAINGHAIGTGFILATFCDIRVAGHSTTFAMPEIDRRLVANPAILRRAGITESMLRELLFTGNSVTAEQLYHTGFFSLICPDEEVILRARAIARTIASKSASTTAKLKYLLNETEQTSWQQGYAMIKTLLTNQDERNRDT